jgi:hypothetical protein
MRVGVCLCVVSDGEKENLQFHSSRTCLALGSLPKDVVFAWDARWWAGTTQDDNRGASSVTVERRHIRSSSEHGPTMWSRQMRQR